jgi:hypothetical protein
VTDRFGKDERGEMKVPPGFSPQAACKALVKLAPAFMLYNDTRVECKVGDTAEELLKRLTYMQCCYGAGQGDGRSREILEIMNRAPMVQTS